MRQIWSLGAGRIFFKSGRIAALTCLFACSASSMTIDETVNVANAPSCSIRSAIDAVADIVHDSMRKDLGIAEKNITAMGWIYNSRRGKWIVSIADLRRYEFSVSSGRFRLMPEDEITRIIKKRMSGGSQM